MNKAEASFEITNERGLHARAATLLAKVAQLFDAQVTIQRDGHHADARSVIELLLLCGHPGTRLKVRAQGQQAHEAVRAIGDLINDGFGEPS